MFDLLVHWIKTGKLTTSAISLNSLDPQDIKQLNLARIKQLSPMTRQILSRSLNIRHLDAGSCNAEEAELLALSNPYYDLTRFGFEFTASPRHADILTVSGPITRHLVVAMKRTYHAMPHPKIVVAIGDGACNGSLYDKTYACLGSIDTFLPVDVYIPGDPPTPQEILEGLLKCKLILASKEDIAQEKEPNHVC
jgi:Ni,Fe-hydrogenase III small subunit